MWTLLPRSCIKEEDDDMCVYISSSLKKIKFCPNGMGWDQAKEGFLPLPKRNDYNDTNISALYIIWFHSTVLVFHHKSQHVRWCKGMG
mmetsp:Transcript_7549/g.17292  ORF Transcript_7549/g.17292 Transcript_7549/m.17292 type:complete len:88 (-) Transcript_7549:692-955(-)